jgi:hypothetical protein
MSGRSEQDTRPRFQAEEKAKVLTTQDNRIDLLIISQGPDEELREVTRVYKLPQRRARAGYNEGLAVLCPIPKLRFQVFTMRGAPDLLFAR